MSSTVTGIAMQTIGVNFGPDAGIWVQLKNLATLTIYTSGSAAAAGGIWSVSNVPAGAYEVYFGPSSTGPWTDSGSQTLVPPNVNSTETIVANWTHSGDAYFKSGRPWFDVCAFGADPAGSLDSTAALNLAVAAAPSTGAIIFFSEGTYSIGIPTYTVKNNLTFLGYGATLKRTAGTGGIGSTSAIIRTGNGNSVLGLTFDGNFGNTTVGTNGNLLLTNGENHVTVRDCTFQNSWEVGYQTANANYITVENCTFNGTGNSTNTGQAFLVGSGTNAHYIFRGNTVLNTGLARTTGQWAAVSYGAGVADVRVSNNYIQGFNFIGLGSGSGGSDHVISNNYIDNTGFTGVSSTAGCIDTGNCTNITVIGNICNSSASGTGGGIGNAPPNFNAVISGNLINNSSIYMSGNTNQPSNYTIANNVILNAPSYGIAVAYVNECSVVGNTINGFASGISSGVMGGIYLDAQTGSGISNVVVAGNTVTGGAATGTGTTWGIFCNYDSASTISNVLIANNMCSGNQGGGAGVATDITSGESNLILRGNLGTNPVGLLPVTRVAAAPTLPASGTPSGTCRVDSTVYITAGTSAITAVKIGASTITGYSIPASTLGAPLRIPAGQTVTLTYAGGTPTWQWVGD